MGRIFSIYALFVFSVAAHAAQLPSALSTGDVAQSVEILGFASANRALLPAESLGIEPGIRVGLSQTVVVLHDLKELGAADGSFPDAVPLPSLQITKGLPWDLEAQVSIAPPKVLNYVESYGGGLAWTFLSERDFPVALSLRGHFSYASLLSGDYTGWNWGFLASVSKDYVSWVPFAHVGVAFADGCIAASRVAAGQESCQGAPAGVGAIGVAFEGALTIVTQIDTHNLNPGFSVFIGKTF